MFLTSLSLSTAPHYPWYKSPLESFVGSEFSTNGDLFILNGERKIFFGILSCQNFDYFKKLSDSRLSSH